MTQPFPRSRWYLLPTLERQGLRFELPYQERLRRVGIELGRRLHEHGMRWWDRQLEEYQALPPYKDFPGLWEEAVTQAGGRPEDHPFWLLTTRSMQYAWGGNAGVQMIREVAENIAGHRGVIVNPRSAAALGIADGDAIEISTPKRSVRGRAVLRQGIRPDTLLLVGQFDHWATPLARDFGMPSLNTLASMSIDLTDATGSSADIVRVRLAKAGSGGAAARGRAP
jgi:phenylacetyl-CoA:acceptor oxidoreductase